MPKKPPPLRPKNHDWSRFLIQNTPGAVITADQEGRITEFNPAAKKKIDRLSAGGRPWAARLRKSSTCGERT